MKALSSTELARVDEYILSGNRLQGLQFLMEVLEIGLPTALDTFVRRYDELRQTRSDDFTRSTEDYWKGFSS